MRIINGNCIPSVTDIMRAAAHCRALAAGAHYSGRIAAYWDLDDGSVSYHDFIGGGWLQCIRRVEIASAEAGRGLLYAGTAADKRTDAEQVRAEMLRGLLYAGAADGGYIDMAAGRFYRR